MSALARLDDSAADKLIKVLRLCSSDFVGERAAAANAANRLLVGLGLDWADVIRPARTSPSSAVTWRDDLDLADRHLRDLTTWEAGFLCSMKARSSATVKQRAVLVEIAARLRARGRA